MINRSNIQNKKCHLIVNILFSDRSSHTKHILWCLKAYTEHCVHSTYSTQICYCYTTLNFFSKPTNRLRLLFWMVKNKIGSVSIRTKYTELNRCLMCSVLAIFDVFDFTTFAWQHISVIETHFTEKETDWKPQVFVGINAHTWEYHSVMLMR